ncbi:MAG TPA: immunoglobulin-like domain-containing protein [Solirubrobacterales bacterium]|nr:immunoglobulin-like domain-containing protein [Solirubrobacterales bacterium]
MTRLAGLIVVALLAVPASALAAPEPPFCDSTIVAPVRQSPADEPKPDGRLGFGPAGVRMAVPPRLVTGGGKIGYELYLDPRAKVAHPRWRIITLLRRLKPSHPSLTFAGEDVRRLRTITPDRRLSTYFNVSDKPAGYAVIAIFTSLDGRRELGRFRLHFKVMPPTFKARLALDASSYSAGQTVFGRIENLGTEKVSYGASYRIERYDGATWALAPETPNHFTLRLYFAPPGETGSECSPFLIPASMAPGRYRMSKEVNFAESLERDQISVSAEFEIAP